MLRSFAFSSPTAGIGLALIMLFLGLAIAGLFLHGPAYGQDLVQRLEPPGTDGHLLGTDTLGRDVFARICVAIGISLEIGAAAVAIAGVVGVSVGMVAGYFGGWIDDVLMRCTDAVLAIPIVLLALSVLAVIGGSEPDPRDAFTQWMTYARTYAETLSLASRTSSATIGITPLTMLRRHICRTCCRRRPLATRTSRSRSCSSRAQLSWARRSATRPSSVDARRGALSIFQAPWLPSIRIACCSRCSNQPKAATESCSTTSVAERRSAVSFRRTWNPRRHLAEARGLPADPSISTLPEHAAVSRAADWVADEARSACTRRTARLGGNPIVYGSGSKPASADAPRAGHTTSAGRSARLWLSPPFRLTSARPAVRARGARQQGAAVRVPERSRPCSRSTAGSCNVKVLIEGEELRADHLDAFMEREGAASLRRAGHLRLGAVQRRLHRSTLLRGMALGCGWRRRPICTQGMYGVAPGALDALVRLLATLRDDRASSRSTASTTACLRRPEGRRVAATVHETGSERRSAPTPDRRRRSPQCARADVDGRPSTCGVGRPSPEDQDGDPR